MDLLNNSVADLLGDFQVNTDVTAKIDRSVYVYSLVAFALIVLLIVAAHSL